MIQYIRDYIAGLNPITRSRKINKGTVMLNGILAPEERTWRDPVDVNPEQKPDKKPDEKRKLKITQAERDDEEEMVILPRSKWRRVGELLLGPMAGLFDDTVEGVDEMTQRILDTKGTSATSLNDSSVSRR